MLDILRQNQKSAVIYVFFGMIIVVFVVFFGPQSQSCSEGGVAYAARVNGELVPESEFQTQYQMRFRAMQQGNPDFNDTKAKEMDLKRTVLDQLVDQYVLAQEAARRGLTISDDELAKKIAETSYFQKEGKFDPELYEKLVLYYFRQSMASFEESQRRAALADKLLDTLRSSINVSQAEVREEFENRNTKANVQFVKIDPNAKEFTEGAEPTEAELSAALTGRADEIKKYYEENDFKFKTDEKRRGRRLLVTLKAEATADEEKAARSKAEEALAEIQKGGDFGEIVKKYTTELTAAAPGTVGGDKSGDMGFAARGAFEKPVDDALWGLEVGKVSDIVRSKSGFEIVKLEEIQAQKVTPLDEAKQDIAKELLKKESAKKRAQEEVDRIAAGLAAGKTFEELLATAPPPAPPAPEAPKGKKGKAAAAPPPPPPAPTIKSYGLSVEETGLFAKSPFAYVPHIGIDQHLQDVIFSLTTEKGLPTPGFVEVSGRFYVLKLKERVAPDETKFEEDSKEIVKNLRLQKAGAVMQEWVKARREGSSVERNAALLLYGEEAAAARPKTES